MTQKTAKNKNKLPEFIVALMRSSKTSEINARIAQKFGLSPEQTMGMVASIVEVIRGDKTPLDLPNQLRMRINISLAAARRIALEICLERLLAVRDYVEGVEEAIKTFGGRPPSLMPALASEQYKKQILAKKLEFSEKKGASLSTKAQPREEKTVPSKQPPVTAAIPSPPQTSKPVVTGKETRLSLKELLDRYPDVQKQLITTKPIVIREFKRPVRPTLENWLTDYKERAGGGRHTSVERGEYLFKSANAMALDEPTRLILSGILRSYDEGTPLPINPEDGRIVLSELLK